MILSDNDEASQHDVLVIGPEAGPDSPDDSGEQCFNITVGEDDIKEGRETFTLTLYSDDGCVWLGRDRASVSVPANDSKH